MPQNYNRIKEILIEKGIKQAWLAERLGMTLRNLFGYLGNYRQPSIEQLYAISLLLDCEINDLLLPKDAIFTEEDVQLAKEEKYFYSKKH